MSSEYDEHALADEALLPMEVAIPEEMEWQPPSKRAARLFSIRFVIIHGCILALSLACGVGIAVWQSPGLSRSIEVCSCIPSSQTSNALELPLFDHNHDGYELRRFTGSPDKPSKFKGPPSADVDRAWRGLWTTNMLISAADYASTRPQFAAAGVKVSSPGGDLYLATFEATHQLHCLYNLFRASHAHYYQSERKAWSENPEEYHARLGVFPGLGMIYHCIDILRQKLMCDADAGVVTYNWVEGNSQPVPNFNVMHQCRDYDRLLAYAKQHDSSETVFNHSYASAELEGSP